MRTKVAPGCSPSQSSTSPICRDQRDRRRFEVVAAFTPVAERPAIDAVPARENLGGRKRHAGIDQQHRRARQSRGSSRRVELIPRPVAARGHAEQAGGNVAAELGRDRRAHAPGRSPTAGSAAAAPPPRRPSRRRCRRRPARFLLRCSAAPAADSRRPRASAARRLHHEIVVMRRKVGCERPGDVQRRLVGRLRAQPVAIGAEGEDRLDPCRPSGSLPADVQREVELGRRRLSAKEGSRRRGGRRQAGIDLRLDPRLATSSSALTSAALHANRAS